MAVIQLGQRRGTGGGSGIGRFLLERGERKRREEVEVRSTQAKIESDQAVRTRAYAMEAYKSYWRKKEAGQNIGEKEENELEKFFKKRLPEWVDSGGRLIRYPIEREPTPKQQNDAKIALEKRKRGLPPTAKEAAGVITVLRREATEESRYGGEDPSKLREIDEAIKFYMQFIKPNRFTGALGEGGQPGVNERDPLGILPGR